MNKRKRPPVIAAMGRLRMSTVERMTDDHLKHLRDCAECIRAMATAELRSRNDLRGQAASWPLAPRVLGGRPS